MIELVVFDDEKEVDWVDPIVHVDYLEDGSLLVNNGYGVFHVNIPVGGRYEFRHKKEDK